MANDDLEAIPFMDTMNSRRAGSAEYAASSHPDEPLTPNTNPQTPDGNAAGGRNDVWKFGDLGGYWGHVDKMTNQYHDELVKGLKDNLDNLL